MKIITRSILVALCLLLPMSLTVHAKTNKSKKKSSVAVPSASPTPQKSTSRLDAWLKKMKKKAASAQSKHNKLVSVAAVRGDEVKEAPPLYWKGQKSEGPLKAEELAAFENAIDTAMTGDKSKATVALNAFVSSYPESHLKPDVDETLKLLSTDGPEKEKQ